MKIIGLFSISDTNNKMFTEEVQKAINKLQNDGQEVEIQYEVNSFPNGQIVMSALILGRK